MKSTDPTTPIIVGALSIASIIGASVYVLTQSNASNASTGTTTTAQTATKETTSQATDTAAASNTASTVSPTTNTTNTANSSSYKDGTYTASANYGVPHGFQNSIKVTLTVTNGKVTSAEASHDYNDRESGMYVDSFDSSLDSAVVGKAIASLSPSRIGGASLTTYGFDDALAIIANQAKA